ncbi:MAG: 3-methyl-2-oxobutanoate dehydrogenase subunit VorB [Anaerolineaceae bacterium]|nr:3-methyl-2-oxobutanoate dehydrogenase subunit VorB [Anaerolineaceae bacterium]
MTKQLLKGNVAIAEAAVRYGLQAYFGYPITPQTELLEYLSKRMPELGRVFVQAESELGAVNMVYGAACTGARVMSSSSSPGVSLMLEGLSYIAGTELPAVFVDVMRGGPGLGNIAPSQQDYNQIVHGGGHGDYYPIVLAPANIQEAIDYIGLAFTLAEKYRSLAILLIDGCLGQMMEPAELPEMQPVRTVYPAWAARGAAGREPIIHTSIYLNPLDQEKTNLRILSRWREVQAKEIRFRGYYLDDAKYAIIAFGTAGRVALSAVRAARNAGIKVGMFRPITLAPFPAQAIRELSERLEGILVVEMNSGQMLEDVLANTHNRAAVEFYGRPGGNIPLADDILTEIKRIAQGKSTLNGHPRDRWVDRMLAANPGA